MVAIFEYIKTIGYEPMIFILSIVGGTCLLSLYYFRWRDYRLPSFFYKRNNERKNIQPPKLSVIIPVSAKNFQIDEHIQLILEQDYPDFEVIVVDESEDNELKNKIESMQLHFPKLRYTYVPSSIKDICIRRMAITLGCKAAHAEWVVITSISAFPISKNWLKSLSFSIHPQSDIIIGYANFINDGSDFAKKAIYERIRLIFRCFRSAKGHGAIFGDEVNFCIRKTAFMNHKGNVDHLQIKAGIRFLLMDLLSTSCNVNVVVDTDSVIKERLPSFENWQSSEYNYREVLRHTSRYALYYYLWRDGIATLSLYVFLFTMLCYTTMRLYNLFLCQSTSGYVIILDIFMVLFLTISYILPQTLFRKATKILGESNYGFYIIMYEIFQPLKNYYFKIKTFQRK